MRQNRERVLDWIGLSEGGYVNHPRDPGKATDRGITQATYDAWNRAKGRHLKPVRGISESEAREILASQYLDTVAFDRLPAGVDYAVADYGVNSGPGRAAKVLQRVLGVEDDGVIGVMTLSALSERSPVDVINAICDERMAFLRRLDTWDVFGRGWTTRVVGRVAGAQEDDIGVIDRATKLARGTKSIPAPTTVAPGKGRETTSAIVTETLEARVTTPSGTTGALESSPVAANPLAQLLAALAQIFRRKQ